MPRLHSDGGEAAVDGHGDAGGEAGARGAEEKDGCGDLIDLAEAADGMLGEHVVAYGAFDAHAFVDFSFDHRGTYRIDAHTLGTEFSRCRFGQANDGEFAGV